MNAYRLRKNFKIPVLMIVSLTLFISALLLSSKTFAGYCTENCEASWHPEYVHDANGDFTGEVRYWSPAESPDPSARQDRNTGGGGGGGCIANEFNHWGKDCPQPAPCDANSWGGWSGCSVSCGPGTQSRTNACGTTQTQSCQVNDPNVWSAWSECSKVCDGGIQTRTNACGTPQTQACNTFSCYISYPTPTPTIPTPTPVGYTPTPSPTPSTHGYFPGWFKTENGDVHSNKDIIVSLPSLLSRFADFLVTVNNLSSFAAGSAQDARPELASAKNWYWYSPPYGAINFPENAGFYTYYTHNKPPENKIVSDGLNNSTINSLAQNGKPPKIQIDSTINTLLINESITLSSDKILVLYINGDLNINANITLSDNSGIVFVVKGNLNIAPQVTQADGFYLVDKVVNSTDGSGAGGSLLIHGAVFVSQNGRIFGTSRQIHDANTPSEKIIYEQKYLINFAQSLGHAGITWREVAP